MKLFLFFMPILFFCQPKITPQYIDSESQSLYLYARKGEYDKSIKKAYEILEYSKKINYSKGLAIAYMNLSKRYFFNGDFKKCLLYLKRAEKEKYVLEDPEGKIRLKHLYSNNYMNVGLYDESLKELREIISMSRQAALTDSLKLNYILVAQSDIGVTYRLMKKYDSATINMQRAVENLRKQKHKMSKTFQCFNLIFHCILSQIKIEEGKIDSAAYYINLIETAPKDILGNNRYMYYKTKGLVNFHKHHYDDAIKDYELSIQYVKNVNNKYELLFLYNVITEAYKKNNDEVNNDKYNLLYGKLSDSLNNANIPVTESTVNLLISHMQRKNHEKQNWIYVGLGSGFCLVLISFYLVRKRKEKNKQKIILNLRNELSSEKNKVSFDEVIQLAKTNDSSFLVRFLEIYPNFQQALLDIEPSMQSTEIKFCALIFLQFSTKEIANYTFVLPRSIQTRKSRLRKKLNIPSDQDVYVWMKNLDQT